MIPQVTPLPFKPSQLRGLSERLLVSHYENNYGGALRRLQAIQQRLTGLDWTAAAPFEINGLKREELIALASVTLHEIYFDCLGGAGGEPDVALAAALESDFGSFGRWRSEFTAMAKALAGGSGWVLLLWSPRSGSLLNQWAADHAHALVCGIPILALDLYEHAYHLDFGAKAAAYVEAIMDNLHWDRIAARWLQAVAAPTPPPPANADTALSAERLRSLLERGDRPLVIDVRTAQDRAQQSDLIPGAMACAPEEIAERASSLPSDRLIVVCCTYGFQVSAQAAAGLRGSGLEALSLAGGMAAWHAIGGPTEPFRPSSGLGKEAP